MITVRDQQTGTLVKTHTYDAEGRRVRTVHHTPSPDVVERLVYWGDRLAGTYNESSQETKSYGYVGAADGEAFVEITGSATYDGTYHLVRNFQGSVIALAGASGTLLESYSYTAFGKPTIMDVGTGQVLAESDYGLDRFFLGRPYDAEVSLYDLRARWYDTRTGSFLSPDPLGAIDSCNLYQYGFGTPNTWIDPTGLNSQCPSYTYQDYLQAVQNQIREEENEDAEMCSWNPYHEPDDEEPDPTGGVSEQDWNDVEGEYGLHLCNDVATYNESATLRELAKFEEDHPGVLEQIVAAGVSSIPIVGDIYDFLSGLFGVDLITGETLRGAERLLQLAGILPGVSGSALRRTTNFVGDVAKGGKNVLPSSGGKFVVDSKGNTIPLKPGETFTASPDGKWVQVRGPSGEPTGLRLDGAHKPSTHQDPRALRPHGHVPGLTNPDGTPWLPVKQ